MNNKLYIRMSTAITVLSLLAIFTERSSSAPLIAKIFSVAFIVVIFNAIFIIGFKKTIGDDELRSKFMKAITLTGIPFFAGLILISLRMFMPETYNMNYTYIAAGIFFISLLVSSTMLGLVQATNNNRNEN